MWITAEAAAKPNGRAVRQAGHREQGAAADRGGDPDQGERGEPVIEVFGDGVPDRMQRARADDDQARSER